MTGGTENTAATKLVKTLGVSAEDVEGGDGSASEVPWECAKTEGTLKAVESMFASMAPLKKGKKHARDSSSDDEDNGKKRRRTGKKANEAEGEDTEAG